jgi:hypothetical protein
MMRRAIDLLLELTPAFQEPGPAVAGGEIV